MHARDSVPAVRPPINWALAHPPSFRMTALSVSRGCHACAPAANSRQHEPPSPLLLPHPSHRTHAHEHTLTRPLISAARNREHPATPHSPCSPPPPFNPPPPVRPPVVPTQTLRRSAVRTRLPSPSFSLLPALSLPFSPSRRGFVLLRFRQASISLIACAPCRARLELPPPLPLPPQPPFSFLHPVPHRHPPTQQ